MKLKGRPKNQRETLPSHLLFTDTPLQPMPSQPMPSQPMPSQPMPSQPTSLFPLSQPPCAYPYNGRTLQSSVRRVPSSWEGITLKDGDNVSETGRSTTQGSQASQARGRGRSRGIIAQGQGRPRGTTAQGRGRVRKTQGQGNARGRGVLGARATMGASQHQAGQL